MVLKVFAVHGSIMSLWDMLSFTEIMGFLFKEQSIVLVFTQMVCRKSVL